MNKINVLIIVLFFSCCNLQKDSERLQIESNSVSSIWINCKKQLYLPNIKEKEYQISRKDYEKVITAINSAQKVVFPDSSRTIKFVSGNHVDDITDAIRIILKSKDTIHIDLTKGAFIWKDIMFTTSLDWDFCRKLCLKCAENDLPIDSLWNMLAFIKFGCLVGGQNVIKGSFGGSGCILTSSPFWEVFFDKPKEELTPFLINKFSSIKKTAIHACPFSDALEGELAVYCLHKIYLKNWYDFDEFSEFKDREITGNQDSDQVWLRETLKDEKKRAILEKLWLSELNKK